MKKPVYPWLDFLKLIMAVSVVAVHTNPLYGIDAPFASSTLNVLESVSVPFFFTVSSFLCFRGSVPSNSMSEFRMARVA